jgi:hypothetical protein
MNRDRIVSILVMVSVLFFAGPLLAQSTVLGLFQIGKSTYAEVKDNLPIGFKLPFVCISR